MDYKRIGQRIREERLRLDLTREKLAELLDLSTNFVGHIERGEKKMSLETLVNIASTLHISLDYLVFGISPEEAQNTSKLIRLVNRCSENEISAITDVVKSLIPHLKGKK